MKPQNSDTLTDYPETPQSHSSWLSWGRRGSDVTHAERRHSKMGHIISSIRQGLAFEHERLPEQSGAWSYNSHPLVVDGHAGASPIEADKIQRQSSWDSEGSISPAVEAQRISESNENNMGAGSHQTPATWGWPGLGAWPEPERARPKIGKMSERERTLSLEPRLEAATIEAIDNAADSESFGWPGVGNWPGSRKS